MNTILAYLKSIYKFIIFFILLLLLTSLFYYLEILDLNIINIINYILTLIMFYMFGLKLSKIKKSKGYLNGFIIGLVMTILFSLITIIVSKYSLNTLIYYLTLILSSITGGIVGVTKK
ncbi:MAG: TIGR04086 family membrane protein [Tenericutes bacterium]|nr:TIGR04086 family membrane protein [Mycoplasmatota bacterium]